LVLNTVPEPTGIALLAVIGLALTVLRFRIPRTSVLPALILLLTISSVASAEPLTFNHELNLFGDWTQYLDSHSHAEVYTEQVAGIATYWRSTPANTWGEVIYRFPLSFEIESASLDTVICAYTQDEFGAWADGGAEAYLDVSGDGSNWTTVLESYPGNAGYKHGPGDITSIVGGSDTIYVRARLLSTRNWPTDGPIFAQFMRTGADLPDKPTFSIQATGVPEPGMVSLLLVLGSWVLMVRRNK
jgi:hypothetical protein